MINVVAAPLLAVMIKKLLQGCCRYSRSISEKYQQIPFMFCYLRTRGHDRVTRAQLFGLKYEAGGMAFERFLDSCRVLADNHKYFFGVKPGRGGID